MFIYYFLKFIQLLYSSGENMYKKSSKNILVFCLVGMLICSFLIVSAASPVGGELDHDQLQNDTVRTGARAITKNLTFYLHKATSANYVFDYSTTSIMNTMVGNNQQHLADWGTVITSWYLQPTLAEDFHIQGDIEIAMKINMAHSPYMPRSRKDTAQGTRRMMSTSNRMKRTAMR